MFWPCCSLFPFKALLYFRHLCYFSWDHVFKELFSFMALLFYSGRFYFIQGALFFLLSAFLILHSAFLILHSAFLFLHSALFSFLFESALVYFLQLWVSCAISLSFQIVCSYYFNFSMWSAYLLISEWDFW